MLISWPFGLDLKSNGTFALKMEEKKVVLFFGLGLKWQRYNHSFYKHFYKLSFVGSLFETQMVTIADTLSGLVWTSLNNINQCVHTNVIFFFGYVLGSNL